MAINTLYPLLVSKGGFTGVIAAKHTCFELQGFEANGFIKFHIFG
jgi:hypothetical protein